ncbi:unnamed protein product [Heterobilharzia americana]|nr:unnamed protein product [Heterobilharzia americana]
MLEAEKYDRTTLVSVDLIDDGSRSRVHLMSSDIKDMHGSSTASPVEVSTRSIPVGSLPAGTSLEPILQGQELFVSSAATCSPVHINPFSMQIIFKKDQNSLYKVSFQHKNYHHEVVQASCKTPVTETPVKTTNLQNHSPSVRGQPDNHTNNKDSITSRSNWARGIFERLRAASLTSSTIESKASHCPYATISYNDSAFRYKDYHHHHQQHDIMNVTPDIIDPRRLPKAHGPVSNCLEFSKRPLQKSNYHTNYISKPIPLSSTHTDLISTSLSSSLQSSTNVNKRRRRVRWFSHSTSCDPEPRDPLFSPSNCHHI